MRIFHIGVLSSMLVCVFFHIEDWATLNIGVHFCMSMTQCAFFPTIVHFFSMLMHIFMLIFFMLMHIFLQQCSFFHVGALFQKKIISMLVVLVFFCFFSCWCPVFHICVCFVYTGNFSFRFIQVSTLFPIWVCVFHVIVRFSQFFHIFGFVCRRQSSR